MWVVITVRSKDFNLKASNIEKGIPKSLQISISNSPADLPEAELPALV